MSDKFKRDIKEITAADKFVLEVLAGYHCEIEGCRSVKELKIWLSKVPNNWGIELGGDITSPRIDAISPEKDSEGDYSDSSSYYLYPEHAYKDDVP